jgi:hypothetical protein
MVQRIGFFFKEKTINYLSGKAGCQYTSYYCECSVFTFVHRFLKNLNKRQSLETIKTASVYPID